MDQGYNERITADPSSYEQPEYIPVFPVVGIGASAGGLEAFTRLLRQLPATTGMAYILVQHLDASHSSALSTLLAQVTSMPIAIIQDQMAIEPDHIYVIPPNADVTLAQGKLILHPRIQIKGQHLVIDRFFHSLAQNQAHDAIGVLLSGTATDGTQGLQAIQTAGGMTFAQDTQSAKYPAMPQHAAEYADYILSPEAIAEALATFHLTQITKKEKLSSTNEQAFTQICLHLRTVIGEDFLSYKPATLQRRMARRMAILHIEQLPTYATYLDTHPAEVQRLAQDVLIKVTRFFRDPDTFETLIQQIIPNLMQSLSPSEPLRIWVAGCATGEEAYSLAICLHTFLTTYSLSHPIQIFASDIDTAALQRARLGIYPAQALQQLPSHYIDQFFHPLDEQRKHYQIRKTIREMCVFAQHNILHDPPFSRLDGLSCRNVLIYLTAEAQQRVLETFHYALKPHGFLLLGKSESIGNASSLFTRVTTQQNIFVKKKNDSLLPLHGMQQTRIDAVKRSGETASQRNENRMEPLNVQQEADRLLLTTYAPASVVIDADMEIVHIRGHISPYLEPASGKATFHLLTWARERLKLELRAAIRDARKEGHLTKREHLDIGDTARNVTITVVPLQHVLPPNHFLILFEERPIPVSSRSNGREKHNINKERITSLEHELTTLYAELTTIREEHRASEEQLQAANEEAQSGNEELQSINEELETGKEELQATNEELTRTNQELETRNEQLRLAQEYTESIVETIREPLLVLDTALQIQQANASFYRFFCETTARIEQLPLDALGDGQWNIPALRTLLDKTLSEDQTFQDFEVEYTSPRIGHKILSLNGRRILQKGAKDRLLLLTMEDITERKALERQKETFLGVVSHELKTPLTGVKGSIQLLQRQLLKAGEEQRAQAVGKIDHHLNRLSHMIDSLLDATALKTGVLSIHLQPFWLHNLIQEIVTELEPTAPGRLHMEPLLPTEAYGDRERTGQVVRNLLVNALKYSPSEKPVHIEMSSTSDAHIISVHDQGKGIPRDQWSKIFDRFERVAEADHMQVAGVGLGLYIAAEIIKRQGGRLWVESEPGRGATFFFPVLLPPLLPHKTVSP